MFALVKEIKSQAGVVHFRRYHLFSTPWFHCYLHRIFQADQDPHLHNHPWTFWGLILKGGYDEETPTGIQSRGWLSAAGGDARYFHKIQRLHAPTTTLFFTGRRVYPWGYRTAQGFIDHETYRSLKHLQKLPS